MKLTREQIEQIRACLGDGSYTPLERKDFGMLCDMALSALAAPVAKIEEPETPPDGWPMHPMLRQWQQYAFSLRAALVEAEARIRNQEAQISGRHQYVGQDYEFRIKKLTQRAEQAESALAAAKEKVERETIEKAANICEGMSKTVHFNEGLKAAAHAIRALKEGGAG
jgi:hypothetical protein